MQMKKSISPLKFFTIILNRFMILALLIFISFGDQSCIAKKLMRIIKGPSFPIAIEVPDFPQTFGNLIIGRTSNETELLNDINKLLNGMNNLDSCTIIHFVDNNQLQDLEISLNMPSLEKSIRCRFISYSASSPMIDMGLLILKLNNGNNNIYSFIFDNKNQLQINNIFKNGQINNVTN